MATASSCVSALPSTRESTGPVGGGVPLVVAGGSGVVGGAPVAAGAGVVVVEPGAVTGAGVIVPPGGGVTGTTCGVLGTGVGGGVTGAPGGIGCCGGVWARLAGTAVSRQSRPATPARTIRMQPLPFTKTARPV